MPHDAESLIWLLVFTVAIPIGVILYIVQALTQ